MIKKQIIQIKREIYQNQSNSESAESSANDLQVQKQIRLLENRLEIANQKFNVTIAENKEMRNEIDNLRR